MFCLAAPMLGGFCVVVVVVVVVVMVTMVSLALAAGPSSMCTSALQASSSAQMMTSPCARHRDLGNEVCNESRDPVPDHHLLVLEDLVPRFVMRRTILHANIYIAMLLFTNAARMLQSLEMQDEKTATLFGHGAYFQMYSYGHRALDSTS